MDYIIGHIKYNWFNRLYKNIWPYKNEKQDQRLCAKMRMFMWVFPKLLPWPWRCACPPRTSWSTVRASGGGLCRQFPHLCWRRNMSNNLLSCIFNCLLEFSSCLRDVLSLQKSSTYLKLNISPPNQLCL